MKIIGRKWNWKFCFLIAIFISGCGYHSDEVTQIAKQYNLNIKDAERCRATFHENTKIVLNWVMQNKSWFFGLLSEDCDDLIAQLPPYGSYDNLLAAKKNNWKIDSPEYKSYVLKRNAEIAQKESEERHRKVQEDLKRMTSGTLVKYEDFGDRWPFTVTKGYIDCVGRSAIFRAGLGEYALNGYARSRGYSPIDPIWRDDPSIPGVKVNIGEMIRIACSSS